MSGRTMKRLESRKSHSWWWDSHISPKNNKWLADNLQEMDGCVKRMLKLIEEEGDSFAKKAEMYYQKRPELVATVEEFYRMYRSLAERYNNLTGELLKGAPSELQSQGSGVSEAGSESGSSVTTPDRRPTRPRSSHRAAGFDVFLGSAGGSTSVSQKAEDDESTSSSSSSESESDGEGASSSSKNNYLGAADNGDVDSLSRRITELECDLRDVNEKLRKVEEENSVGRSKASENGNDDELLCRIAWYENELNVKNEKLQLIEEEIARLKLAMETTELSSKLMSVEGENDQTADLDGDDLNSLSKTNGLEEELRARNEKLGLLEEEIARLKLELEKTKSSETTLRDVEEQVGELHHKITLLEMDVLSRDEEIQELKLAISDADHKFAVERSQLETIISGLSESESQLQLKIAGLELRISSFEEKIKLVEAEKLETQVLEAKMDCEMKELKAEIVGRRDQVEELSKSLDEFGLKYDKLEGERDGLTKNISSLESEVRLKDDRIHEMDEHLHKLHMEHVKLISMCENGRREVEHQRRRLTELEVEVERQRVVISEGAEEKREAIRQLCFSLDHYRNGYDQLRQAFLFHRKQTSSSPVFAS